MSGFLQRFGLILLLLGVGAWGVIAMRGPNGITALAEKRKHIQELQDQNASLAADNLRKRERIELLRTSRQAQELEIRERLKLLRPGETQFIIPNPPREDAPAPGK